MLPCGDLSLSMIHLLAYFTEILQYYVDSNDTVPP